MINYSGFCMTALDKTRQGAGQQPVVSRNLSVCVLLLCLLAGLTACRQQPPEAAGQDQPQHPAIILEVGDRRFTADQLDRELVLRYPDTEGLPAAEKRQLRQYLLHQIIDREVIFAAAGQRQIRIQPEDIEAELTALRGTYTADEFDLVLRRSGRTRESLHSILKLQLLTRKLMAEVIAPQIKVTEKEAADYYHERRDQFQRPTEVRVHQMLFATRDAATEIKKRLQQGEDFATLAREHSLSPDGDEGGLLGYFAEGYLPPEFDAVIFDLPLHQVSAPVESPYGFHLFMVDRKRAAGLRPFAAVKDEIVATLHQSKEDAAFQQWLSRQREQTPIRIAPQLNNGQP